MDAMFALALVAVVLLALDFVALRWGADSREGVEGLEWRRRAAWRGSTR
jgi:hypothetical protein